MYFSPYRLQWCRYCMAVIIINRKFLGSFCHKPSASYVRHILWCSEMEWNAYSALMGNTEFAIYLNIVFSVRRDLKRLVPGVSRCFSVHLALRASESSFAFPASVGSVSLLGTRRRAGSRRVVSCSTGAHVPRAGWRENGSRQEKSPLHPPVLLLVWWFR